MDVELFTLIIPTVLDRKLPLEKPAEKNENMQVIARRKVRIEEISYLQARARTLTAVQVSRAVQRDRNNFTDKNDCPANKTSSRNQVLRAARLCGLYYADVVPLAILS